MSTTSHAPETVSPPAPGIPAPEFEVLGVANVPFMASPSLKFRVQAKDESGLEIYTIALSAQVQLEPALRTHDPATRARLVDLFGASERWSTTTKSMVWTRLTTLVPSFRDATEFELPAPLGYDLDLGICRYLHALDQGEVPLSFHFSGSVVYRDGHGRVQIVQVPWSQASFEMPIVAWRAAMEEHYPGRGWVGVRQETLERLLHFKATHGQLTLDQSLAALLDASERPR